MLGIFKMETSTYGENFVLVKFDKISVDFDGDRLIVGHSYPPISMLLFHLNVKVCQGAELVFTRFGKRVAAHALEMNPETIGCMDMWITT